MAADQTGVIIFYHFCTELPRSCCKDIQFPIPSDICPQPGPQGPMELVGGLVGYGSGGLGEDK